MFKGWSNVLGTNKPEQTATQNSVSSKAVSTLSENISTKCKKSVQMKISINEQGDKFLDEYKENECNDGDLNINNVIKLDNNGKVQNADELIKQVGIVLAAPVVESAVPQVVIPDETPAVAVKAEEERLADLEAEEAEKKRLAAEAEEAEKKRLAAEAEEAEKKR